MLSAALSNFIVFDARRRAASVYLPLFIMATSMLLFVATNFECLASVILSAFVVPLFIAILRRTKVTELCEPKIDNSRIEQKEVPKKVRKKGNSKRKRNRGHNLTKCHNIENVMIDQPQSTQEKDSVEELDKQKNKKKNRSVLANRQISEVCSNQKKVVTYYSPLSRYIQLEMEAPEIYKKFQPFVLLQEDLDKNGFPRFSSEIPGKVVWNDAYKCNIKSDNPNQRWCSRCGDKYLVSDDGLYQSDTMCIYHRGKRQGAGPFSCCGGFLSGCMVRQFHVSSTTATRNVKFMKTREKRQLHAKYHVYGLDCEMCYTLQGLEVTRVSVVGIDGTTVYDSFVLPESPVVDYNTMYSGITEKDLSNTTTTLADVQAFLLKILNARTILIGHGLENDLKALRIVHETIIDTSIVFPHHYGYPYRRSLKSLVAGILKRSIQQGEFGHNSVEDARACVELMLCKIEANSDVFKVPPQQRYPSCPPLMTTTSQWSVNALPFVPAAMMSYNARYWVPPVGSSCDLY